MLERTARELRGESCLALEDIAEPKQQIVCSRSFSKRVESLDELRQSVASYTARVCEKLRAKQQACKILSVTIRTGIFNPTEPIYSNSAITRSVTPTSDSLQLIAEATRILKTLWRPGYRYAKAGVMLGELSPLEQGQADLFCSPQQVRRTQLMQTIDQINSGKHGKVFIGTQGIQRHWTMKRQFLSPAYTTRWGDIPTVGGR